MFNIHPPLSFTTSSMDSHSPKPSICSSLCPLPTSSIHLSRTSHCRCSGNKDMLLAKLHSLDWALCFVIFSTAGVFSCSTSQILIRPLLWESRSSLCSWTTPERVSKSTVLQSCSSSNSWFYWLLLWWKPLPIDAEPVQEHVVVFWWTSKSMKLPNVTK